MLERQRTELYRLFSKPKSRNSMIRTALAPRTTRSGKIFDSRRYSTMKNLSNLIKNEDEIPNESKSLTETVDETKLDENREGIREYKNLQNINCCHESISSAAKQIIHDTTANSLVIEEQNKENSVINIEKSVANKPVKRNKKRRIKPVTVHPSLILLPKIPCMKNSAIGNEKQEKTVRWADDEPGSDGLSQIKEFEEEKPRRRCTMFHKVDG